MSNVHYPVGDLSNRLLIISTRGGARSTDSLHFPEGKDGRGVAQGVELAGTFNSSMLPNCKETAGVWRMETSGAGLGRDDGAIGLLLIVTRFQTAGTLPGRLGVGGSGWRSVCWPHRTAGLWAARAGR